MSEQKIKMLSDYGSRGAIIGALLVAINQGVDVLGYLIMFASSVALLIWCLKTNNKSQSMMYSCYLLLNLIGIASRF